MKKKKSFQVVLTDMTNNCNHRNKFSKTIIYLSQFTEGEKVRHKQLNCEVNESKNRTQFLMKCRALLIGFLATARLKLLNTSAQSYANISVIP